MISVGDLVHYKDQRWKALKWDRGVRAILLENWAGTRIEIPDDFDSEEACERLCNPSKDWPFATSNRKTLKAGRITEIALMRRGRQVLMPYVDWVPVDRSSVGGPIHFNPELHLRYGEVLSVVFQDESRSRLKISRSFGTAQTRLAKVVEKAKQPQTVYERLLADDDYES